MTNYYIYRQIIDMGFDISYDVNHFILNSDIFVIGTVMK